jgi:hypothetical protein
VLVALQLIGTVESKLPWTTYVLLYEVRGRDQNAIYATILDVLDRFHLRMNVIDRETLGARERVTFLVSATRPRHMALIDALQKQDSSCETRVFPDSDPH